MDKIESPEPEDSQGNQLGAAGPGRAAKRLSSSPREGAPRYPGGLGPWVMATPSVWCCLLTAPTALCCRWSVPPEHPRFRGGLQRGAAEHHRGECRGGRGPGPWAAGPGRHDRSQGAMEAELAPTASCPRWPGHHWREAWDPPPLKFLTTSRVCLCERTTPPKEGLAPAPTLESK